MAASAEFRFYEELNDFLAPELRSRAFPVPIDRARSVKDAIESLGVPHTAVDLILVDGASVGFAHVLRGGERVAVYPVFERLDIAPLVHLRPRPLREPRFVADAHLGKLARHLRLAGFDCLWENDFADAEIVAVSVAQKRIVLTRDLGILKRQAVERGHFVRATESGAQLREVVRAFQLEGSLRPFTRCRACNAELHSVSKASIAARLPPEVRLRFDRFTECPQCGRVFWQGTHYERLERLLRGAVA
ncbi:MAG TPA: Mut7-C RNAse domain-containing protein [Burkholderiales bacterium]|nr:Mut7-C RNAse domain-containing protein [Burkholderiales bacterium]